MVAGNTCTYLQHTSRDCRQGGILAGAAGAGAGLVAILIGRVLHVNMNRE